MIRTSVGLKILSRVQMLKSANTKRRKWYQERICYGNFRQVLEMFQYEDLLNGK